MTSIVRIGNYLIEAGANDISKKIYTETKSCVAFTFRIKVNLKPFFLQLPSRVDSCYKVLYAEVKRPNTDTTKRVMQQAELTA